MLDVALAGRRPRGAGARPSSIITARRRSPSWRAFRSPSAWRVRSTNVLDAGSACGSTDASKRRRGSAPTSHEGTDHVPRTADRLRAALRSRHRGSGYAFVRAPLAHDLIGFLRRSSPIARHTSTRSERGPEGRPSHQSPTSPGTTSLRSVARACRCPADGGTRRLLAHSRVATWRHL